MSMPNTMTQEAPGAKLEMIGAGILRYGLAAMLIWVGGLKFATYEAEGIKPLIMNSPLLSWMYSVMSVPAAAHVIGCVEIILGLMILTRAFSPTVSAIGSLGAVVMGCITLSFLLTTPGVWQMGYGFPFLSPNPGAFLAKDLLLLGTAVWTAGESLVAAKMMQSGVRRM